MWNKKSKPWKKVLTYIGFAVASLVIVAVFVTSVTYLQLVIAILLYSLLVYFGFMIFPRKTVSLKVRFTEAKNLSELDSIEPKIGTVDVVDIDKRLFLKAVGATGLSLFLFSLLGRRFESLLFGRVLDSEISPTNSNLAGQAGQIKPSTMDEYKISEIDDDVISYYGFTNKDGSWLIMREDTETNSFRYSKGDSDFSKAWAGRKKLNYDYFHKLS